MITYYRVYFDSESTPYLDESAGSTEEAIQKVLSYISSSLVDKVARVIPLKLYKAVRETVTTAEVELYAENEADVKRILTEFTDGFDLDDYDSTVNLSIDTKLNIKSIEEESDE